MGEEGKDRKQKANSLIPTKKKHVINLLCKLLPKLVNTAHLTGVPEHSLITEYTGDC
jgi:hypothetical protein